MPMFQYTARDMETKKVNGKLEATDRNELVVLLRAKNLFLLECKDVTAKETNTYKMKLKELSSFSREVGTMLNSGVSLIRAMSILVQREQKAKLKRIYTDMYTKLQQGFTLSAAMEAEGRAFPELMINMYRSGENSGHIDQVAMTMAKQYEKDDKIRGKMRSAMIYPIVLVCMMVGAAIGLFIFIIPQFSEIYSNMELPAITVIVMAMSNIFTQYWYWLFIGVLIIVALIASLLRIPEIRYKVDRAKLKMPLIGKLLRTIYTARYARTMCSLYTSGVSIINGLMIVRSVIGNKYIEKQFDAAITSVRNGTSLSLSIQKIDGFDIKLASSIFIGEESGRLDEMLTNLADDFDYDAEIASQRMVALMEPIMIVILAIMVLIVMLAVLLPVVNMYNNPNAIV